MLHMNVGRVVSLYLKVGVLGGGLGAEAPSGRVWDEVPQKLNDCS